MSLILLKLFYTSIIFVIFSLLVDTVFFHQIKTPKLLNWFKLICIGVMLSTGVISCITLIWVGWVGF